MLLAAGYAQDKDVMPYSQKKTTNYLIRKV
jgi:hypothetical protein